MKLAKTLMVQGTASTVGKSTVVTGLCRLFAQEGIKVAPFKAQNMSLNSWVTREGHEMGRAQVVQAEAAGVEPVVEMNPILLKPESDSRSQVIMMGRPLATLEAREYYQNRTIGRSIVQQALQKLRQTHDLVIIEGAGSPVELNLAAYDLVNMYVAQIAEAPVLLVGDIDRGGIFASLLGTLMLLEPDDRARVKALIINKFRGERTLWHAGEQMIAERAGVPVLGTLPFFKDIIIAEEDSVPLEENNTTIMRAMQSEQAKLLEIVIIRFPYLSNYDEFDALAADPRVRISFVRKPEEFPGIPDLIILPGTKNTLRDLNWLWSHGLALHIRQCVQNGAAVLGICGGYQMLGERISDEHGVETSVGTVEPGLGLLPLETFFAPIQEEVTRLNQVTVHSTANYGLLNEIPGTLEFPGNLLSVYQIHCGRTVLLDQAEKKSSVQKAFCLDDKNSELATDVYISEDGWLAGCYLHGLFENDTFRNNLITALLARSQNQSDQITNEVRLFDRQPEYDKLAAILKQHLDIPFLKQIIDIEAKCH